VPVRMLSAEQVIALQSQDLTYREVGGSAAVLPPGYATVSMSRTLAPGHDFTAAVDALMSWQVHTRAGLKVAASAPKVTTDAVVVMRLGIGAFALRIPCRVVYVVDEPDRQGFAYGTLPGHPEAGEESFLVHRNDDGQVTFEITAFSRPASVLAKISGPIGRFVQRVMTTRYLRTLDS
jgi:uncharacterized protein (UPF0548 family)